MLVTFKRRFEQLVWEGLKTHTIRADRKDGKHARAGEIFHCYGDSRQKTMFLIGRWACTRVQRIQLSTSMMREPPAGPPMYWLDIWIDGIKLSDDEVVAFSKADGFPDGPAEMAKYWIDVHGEGDFEGDLNHWRFTTDGRNQQGIPRRGGDDARPGSGGRKRETARTSGPGRGGNG